MSPSNILIAVDGELQVLERRVEKLHEIRRLALELEAARLPAAAAPPRNPWRRASPALQVSDVIDTARDVLRDGPGSVNRILRDGVRVTAAFSRLLRLPGVWVRKVRFEPDRLIVEVALRRRRLVCPKCGFSTRARKDTRPEDSVWRHLDLGVWRLEVHCRRRRLWCPEHGARTEGVPFARPGSEFTRDFECLVAWLATKADKSTIKKMLRVDWDTVGRIVARVCADELDPGRLDDLYEIGVDEVSWKRQHKYLTLVVDHQRRQVVWGCEGSGQAAADAFFHELDPPPPAATPEHDKQPHAASEPAIMVPFGPCPTVPAGHGIPAAWLEPGLELEPTILARAGLLQAVSLDMGPGYAKSVRERAPQPVICIDPYVRHEALPVRVGCETPPPGCRGSPRKLRAA